MGKTNLTAVGIEKLKPPAEGQTDYFDAGYPGLSCRISHGGAKSFIYMYRIGGQKRRLTLGRYPAMSLAEAREAWRAARKTVDRGEDPAAKKPANDFAAVAREWLRRDQAENRSRAEVERVLDHDVKPAWKGRLITDISRRDCLAVIDAVADRGAVTMSRRLHSYLHRLFRWAVGRGIIETSPMADLPKLGREVSRDRVLTDSELAAVWHAAANMGWPFGPAVHLLILTASRREEIGTLRWRQIQDGQITLAPDDTKNKQMHLIPLSGMAEAILANLPRVADAELVFTTTGRTPISGWSRAKRTLDDQLPDDMEPWRIHDLRRTVATGMERLGIKLQVVEAILGHVSGSRAGIVGIYQRHEYTDEKRRALETWADAVEAIIGNGQSHVVPLVTAR